MDFKTLLEIRQQLNAISKIKESLEELQGVWEGSKSNLNDLNATKRHSSFKTLNDPGFIRSITAIERELTKKYSKLDTVTLKTISS